MGKLRGLYKEESPNSSLVKIDDRGFLEDFQKTWTLHNKLEPQQLDYAGQIARIESAGFYRGSDELYKLVGIPGIWHERCLRIVH